MQKNQKKIHTKHKIFGPFFLQNPRNKSFFFQKLRLRHFKLKDTLTLPKTLEKTSEKNFGEMDKQPNEKT